MSRKPLISVVIPTCNRLADLLLALESVRRQRVPRGLTYEVLVVDDGGGDGSFAALQDMARTWRALKVLRQANAGPGVARNLGAKQAKGSVLAFMDDDAVAEPDWLAQGWALLKANGDWHGFEGAVLPFEDKPSELFVHQVANTKGGQWLTCNLWVKRAAFLELGGFDERFRWIREHTEFAFRAMDARLCLPFAPGVKVRHPAVTINAKRFFKDAKDGQYEALLERRHPRRYRQHLKWLDGRAIPAFYLAHYATVVLLCLSPALALAVLFCGWTAVLYAWTRKRHFDLGRFLVLWPLALVIPYVRLAWVAWGYWRYPLPPEK